MTRGRNYQTEAIVLKYRPIGESDRLITFFSSTLGRITGIARGVRRPGSRLGGSLEPLNIVQVSLARGRLFETVSETSVIKDFNGIKSNLNKVALALYVAELTDSFADDWSSNQKLYDLVGRTLADLNKNEYPLYLIHFFELKLLKFVGYDPEFWECVECREKLLPDKYPFAPDMGGVLCSKCQLNFDYFPMHISLGAMKILRYLQRQKDNESISSGVTLPQLDLKEVSEILRNYLRFVAERQLKSTAFLDLVTEMRFGDTSKFM